ncbi:DIP1984 family protein [Tenacibaculum piscium]|uniref:DIP1984 family protein n=1 Tax=Tenacibaculum piscium TaxID=1458515 RepID=UPI001F17D79C|nr:DIP1984 family protein [Tenacibaculum piscium]
MNDITKNTSENKAENTENTAIHKEMKLAEGLLLRADLMKKIEQLQNRIRPVLIVSGDKLPQENPNKLLAQLRKAIQDLQFLVIRINKTNNQTLVAGQGTLMEALAKRDALKMLSEKLRNIRYDAQVNNSGDANLKTTIDIKKLQTEMDVTARNFRELDSKIQETNWLTMLA